MAGWMPQNFKVLRVKPLLWRDSLELLLRFGGFTTRQNTANYDLMDQKKWAIQKRMKRSTLFKWGKAFFLKGSSPITLISPLSIIRISSQGVSDDTLSRCTSFHLGRHNDSHGASLFCRVSKIVFTAPNVN